MSKLTKVEIKQLKPLQEQFRRALYSDWCVPLSSAEEKVRQLVRDNLVENFCNRMIKLQLRSNSSTYFRNYRDFSFRNQREPGENELSCPDDFS